MLGFFYQKGEIFTSPKRNDRLTRGSNHDANIHIYADFAKCNRTTSSTMWVGVSSSKMSR